MRKVNTVNLAVAMFIIGACTSGSPQRLALEPYDARIGYDSVPQALSALRQKKGIQVKVQDDGTISVLEPLRHDHVSWHFVPPEHYAYPTVTKIYDGKYLVRCEASTEMCDRFVRELRDHQEKIIAEI